MIDLLIRTKFSLPYIRPTIIQRPQLEHRIKQGVRGPFTLVAAPAGFGKTTAVSSCITRLGMHVAWLSLDTQDNQLMRFLRYLTATFQELDETIGHEATSLIASSEPIPAEIILTTLINDLQVFSQDVVFVLDDYHLITQPTIHQGLTFLVDHCPQNLHILLISRSDPQLPLARMRARHQLVEIRASELRFSQSEAGQFFKDVMGLALQDEWVSMLEEKTEGWAAGLHMAALSLQRHEDASAFVHDFSGTNRYILEYLADEVLAAQSPEMVDFLIHTAILKRLNASLCDAVFPSSQPAASMLAALQQANLFLIPLDGSQNWYRYHQLFADLLQARLHQQQADDIPQLLSRAAIWCEQHGYFADAIAYALAAPNDELATIFIATYWSRMLNQGEIETVWSWLNALPEERVRRSAPLSVAFCWVLWIRGAIAAIEPHLLNAERNLRQASAQGEGSQIDSTIAQLPAEVATLRSFVARYQSEFERAIQLAEQARQLIAANETEHDDSQLVMLNYLALATAYEGAGELETAVNAYDKAIQTSRAGEKSSNITVVYRKIGLLKILGCLQEAKIVCQDALAFVKAKGISRLPTVGILHLAMSELLIEQNELERAEIHLSQALELGKWDGRLDALRNAAPALVRLHLARGQITEAVQAIVDVEARLGDASIALAKAELLALKAKVLLKKGALYEAQQTSQEAIHLAAGDKGQTGESVAIAALRVLIAAKNTQETMTQLMQSLATAEGQGRLGVVIELNIILGLAWAEQQHLAKGVVQLKHALILAEPERYVRVFLDEGEPMRLLLEKVADQIDETPIQGYVAYLLSQFDLETNLLAQAQTKDPPPQSLIEPLSQREQEVLARIAEGLTNKEIAQQLIVAPGTVKAHTSSIYRKLDVTNRTEAVARARQLNILA